MTSSILTVAGNAQSAINPGIIAVKDKCIKKTQYDASDTEYK